MTAPVTISNSEVLEWQKCERSHFYHFGLGLEPKEPPIRFDRGTTGHRALELATKAKIAGADLREATDIATGAIMHRSLQFLQGHFAENYQAAKRTEMFTELVNVVSLYLEHYWDNDEIRPILVEETFKVPVSSTVTYGLRADVVGEYTKFPYKGDYVISDWKFRYNFINPDLLPLNGQLHKYVFGVSTTGMKITKGIFDQVRYRKLKDPDPLQIFKREILVTKPKVRENIIETHISVAEDIAKRKVLPVHVQSQMARRNLSEFACKDCLFRGPCLTELRGDDPSSEISNNYKPSEYGYVEEESLAF